MIEKDIMLYLQTVTALTTKLGGANKICLIQAPPLLKMPWLVLEASGGTVERIGANKQEEQNQMRFAVDVGPTQMVVGRAAIGLARDAIQHMRGNIGDSSDIIITCGAINGYAGLDGAYRFGFSADCKYVEAYATQTPVLPST